MASRLITGQAPYPNQPCGFDEGNFYGSKCIGAIVPGWGTFRTLDSPNYGATHSVGHYRRLIEWQGMGAGTAEFETVSIARTGFQPYKSVQSTSQDTGIGSRMGHVKASTDYGIFWPGAGNICAVALFVPLGSGRPGGAGDPRIFSQDLGTGGNDHDFMIGLVESNSKFRARIRLSGGTQTIVTGSVDVQQDSLNMVVGGIAQDVGGGNYNAYVIGMREDGEDERGVAASTPATGFDPRTTTDIALYANAGADDNSLVGHILVVYFFNTAFVEAEQLWSLFYNPWQVFEQPGQRRLRRSPAVASGGGLGIPIAMHNYRMRH